MAHPLPDVYAPGMSEGEVSFETDWLREFSKASDLLDWSQWGQFWDDSAVFQFNNRIIEGKNEIGKYFEQQFRHLESMEHVITRLSFVSPHGIVFQNANVSYRVKGDELNRIVTVPGIAVIHKQPGEGLLKKFETYIDTAPLASVIREVSQES